MCDNSSPKFSLVRLTPNSINWTLLVPVLIINSRITFTFKRKVEILTKFSAIVIRWQQKNTFLLQIIILNDLPENKIYVKHINGDFKSLIGKKCISTFTFQELCWRIVQEIYQICWKSLTLTINKNQTRTQTHRKVQNLFQESISSISSMPFTR